MKLKIYNGPKIVVIYHGNCADGFTAAWVVRKYMIEEAKLDPAGENFPVFIPGVYGEKLPVEVANAEVILVDFSYKLPVMVELCRLAKGVLVIDHHKTAMEDLAGLPGSVNENYPLEVYFDMEHSGAMLAWMYFYNDAIPPAGLKHVEDRDLWKFKLFGTREYNANMFSYPYTWENWDRLMNEPIDQVIRDGMAIDRKHFKDIREMIEVCARRMVFSRVVNDTVEEVEIPVVNIPYTMGSDAAAILAEEELKQGRPAVAAYYYDTPQGRNFGFRSIGDYDCSLFAKYLGGGGHKNAAGCNRLSSVVYPNLELYGSPHHGD